MVPKICLPDNPKKYHFCKIIKRIWLNYSATFTYAPYSDFHLCIHSMFQHSTEHLLDTRKENNSERVTGSRHTHGANHVLEIFTQQ